jgi:hypothetical protein
MPQQLAEIEVVDLRSAQLARVAVVRRLAVNWLFTPAQHVAPDLGDQRNLLNPPLLFLVVTELGGTKRWTGTGLKEIGKRRREK